MKNAEEESQSAEEKSQDMEKELKNIERRRSRKALPKGDSQEAMDERLELKELQKDYEEEDLV